MKKALIVLLVLAVAGGLFAQTSAGTYPRGEVNSPSHWATFSRLGAPGWDDLWSVVSYSAVPINNWYGGIGFAPQNYTSNTPMGFIGYAQKIGDLYLGVYYGGNLWTGYFKPAYTERDFPGSAGWSTTGTSMKTFKDFGYMDDGAGNITNPLYPSDRTTYNDNRISVIIGVANMGFKVSYASTHTSYKSDDIMLNDGSEAAPGLDIFARSYDVGYGWIQPDIHWGFVTGLLEGGLKPNVKVVLGFARDNLKADFYDGSGNPELGELILRSQNYFEPRIILDTENWNFYKSASGFAIGLRFDYDLTLRIYNNEYSYTDGTGKAKTESIKGFATLEPDFTNPLNSTMTFNEYTYNRHQFQLRTSAAFDDGPLSLRLRLYTPVSFTNQTSTEYQPSATFGTNGKLDNAIGVSEVDSFTFVFNPKVELAARFRTFNNRLTINMGGQFSAGSIGWTSADRTTYEAAPGGGTKAADNGEQVKYDNQWGTWASDIRAGFFFKFTDNFAVDAACGIANGNFNVFESGTPNSGGLFNFGQVMVHLYF